MALTKDLALTPKQSLAGAYIKICRIEMRTFGDDATVEVQVATYEDKAAADADADAPRRVAVRPHNLGKATKDMTIASLLEWAYGELKKLPEYAGASDA